MESIESNDNNLPSPPSTEEPEHSPPVQPEEESVIEGDRPDLPASVSVEELTLKNLDTGEQFIIGENDPDFDFDTFQLKRGVEVTPIIENNPTFEQEPLDGETSAHERRSWWRSLLNLLYGGRDARKLDEVARKNEDLVVNQKPRTPFTKLSNFKFRKELGRGAFGRVLLAEAKTDGKLYALKIITKKNMRSSDKRQAKAERDILHAMTLKAPHPFTSDLKFAFQSENNLYLGMDYIPGGNLRELIKKFKSLPEDWVRFYAAELVLAISHLHSLNVLYRDIKPHNVMIDARGHLKLIDFGLSKQEIVHPRGALSLVGTPDYSAPEVLKTGVQQIEAHNRERAAANGKKTNRKNGLSAVNVNQRIPKIGYGKAADWWSLGIMIYEMISGTPTFRGADLRQTYQRILYADLEFYPEEKFTVAAKLLLGGLIKRDPSTRLGAWENPPTDIMTSPFFNGTDWEAIYERKTDGPFVPEIPNFAKRGSSSAKSIKASSTMFSAGEISPANQANNETRPTGSPSTKDNATIAEDDEDGDELAGMRDSLFIRSKEGGNALPDWSFIDEQVLRSSINPELGEQSSMSEARSEQKMPSSALEPVPEV